jgi:hypothetical protein
MILEGRTTVEPKRNAHEAYSAKNVARQYDAMIKSLVEAKEE